MRSGRLRVNAGIDIFLEKMGMIFCLFFGWREQNQKPNQIHELIEFFNYFDSIFEKCVSRQFYNSKKPSYNFCLFSPKNELLTQGPINWQNFYFRNFSQSDLMILFFYHFGLNKQVEKEAKSILIIDPLVRFFARCQTVMN